MRTSGKGYKTTCYICSRRHAAHKHECPKAYTVPADLVEQHILGLIRGELLRLRDDTRLHQFVDAELRRLQGHQYDAREQLQRRLADLDQRMAKLSDHLMALDPKTADSLRLYAKADDLMTESSLAELGAAAGISPPADLRARIAAEFDRMESVMASGTLEERRALIACYLHSIKADPDSQEVRIGLYPVVLSQIIVLAGLWSGCHPHSIPLNKHKSTTGSSIRPDWITISSVFAMRLVSPATLIP